MDLAEALRVLNFEVLADPEQRRKHFRQIQLELQQRADRGESDIDQVRVRQAMELLGRAIDGGAVSRTEMSAAAETIRKALEPAELLETPPQPTTNGQGTGGWTTAEKALPIGGGLGVAALIGFAVGRAVRDENDNA